MKYSPRLDTEDYVEQDQWVHLVAEHLYNGSLALVLGAGVSADLGLPTWMTLVQRCLESAGMTFDSDKLPERHGLYMDDLEDTVDRHEYTNRVATALYEGVNLGSDICQSRLLIALGALMMGSRRGSVREVITFNFDVVLEYYLSLHGFAVQSYDSLPQLRTACDVRVGHINGILGHPAFPVQNSKRLILSARSMEERMGATIEAWKDVFRDLLKSHLVLFVGLSGNDPIFGPLLSDVAPTVQAERVTGVWLFGRNIDEDDGAVYTTRYFEKRNVVPVCLSSYAEIPERLLEVCQIAARQF